MFILNNKMSYFKTKYIKKIIEIKIFRKLKFTKCTKINK